jgi:orotate phosphoribosyltransferase
MTRRDDIRDTALKDLQQYEVLMLNGHFDFGNGFHGSVYLNPHKLFRYPSMIWRFAQDLLDVVPAPILEATEVVAGPITGGALLGHTIAGLLDSRRDLARPATLFAPFTLGADGLSVKASGDSRLALTRFYGELVSGKRALIVDDVRNTGQTLAHCVELVRKAGASVIATAEIYDRMEAMVDAGVPNFALAEYKAPDNVQAEQCPMCRAGMPVTTF